MVAAHLQELAPLYSIDAEMSTLGSMLLSDRAAEEIVSIITDEDFYHPANREIFRAMRQLLTNSKSIDEVTLPQELIARGVYESIGGWDYIATIAEKVPSAANAIYYAQAVLDASTLRRLEG